MKSTRAMPMRLHHIFFSFGKGRGNTTRPGDAHRGRNQKPPVKNDLPGDGSARANELGELPNRYLSAAGSQARSQ
jgi:hypothetical protein